METAEELEDIPTAFVDLRAYPAVRKTIAKLDKNKLISDLPALVFFYDRNRATLLFVPSQFPLIKGKNKNIMAMFVHALLMLKQPQQERHSE